MSNVNKLSSVCLAVASWFSVVTATASLVIVARASFAQAQPTVHLQGYRHGVGHRLFS